MNKKLIVLAATAALIFGLVAFLKFSPSGTEFVWRVSSEGTFLMPLVLVAALLDSINPCAFSILLLTIAFLFSIGKMRGGILKMGAVYIAGLFVVYMFIGLGILQALHLFDTPHFMAKVGAVLLIALGAINLINHFFPAFPLKLRIPQAAYRKIAELMERGSIPTAFALGALVGLCEFPCTGGPYLLVLGLLHDQGTYLAGLGYLLLYNLIFVLPLVVILLIASEQALLLKVRAWQRSESGNMRLWGGVAMVALGAIIFFL